MLPPHGSARSRLRRRGRAGRRSQVNAAAVRTRAGLGVEHCKAHSSGHVTRPNLAPTRPGGDWAKAGQWKSARHLGDLRIGWR